MAEERDRNLQPGSEPLAARVLGRGARGARNVADATGLGQAFDAAAEESIVRAVESPALERALIRLAEEGRLEDVLVRTAAHADVEDLVLKAIDSEAADRIWERILASDKAQMLVERVAEAPEVRAAIAQQGVGLIGDIGRQVRRITRPLDGVLERIARAALRRQRRERPTEAAGFVTRSVAGAIDVTLLLGGLSLASGLIASILNFIFGFDGGLTTVGAVVLTGLAFVVGGATIIGFWALAGRTPGMSFLAIHLDAGGERRIGGRRALKRLLALPVALLPLGLGFFAILVNDRRRGWHDSIANTDVLYDPDERAPWANRD